jgi:hypothetical protein
MVIKSWKIQLFSYIGVYYILSYLSYKNLIIWIVQIFDKIWLQYQLPNKKNHLTTWTKVKF